MPVTVPSKMLGRLGSHGRWHVYSWSFNFMQWCISHKSLWLCDLHTEGFVQIKPFMISVVKLQYFIAFIQCILISLRFKCYRFSWKLKSLSWYRGPVSSYCYNWNCPEIVLSFKNTFYFHCRLLKFSNVSFIIKGHYNPVTIFLGGRGVLHSACRILDPQQGLNPLSWQWKHGTLTTREFPPHGPLL